ncbi:MAG: hypothetical protein U0802_19895 [Candidatus Binatia bacterium]
MPSFRSALTRPPEARARALRDPAVRERMRAELADPTGRARSSSSGRSASSRRCATPSTPAGSAAR